MRISVRILGILAVFLALFCALVSHGIGLSWAKFGELIPRDPELYAELNTKPLDPHEVWYLVPAGLAVLGAAAGIAGVVLIRRGALAGAMFMASALLCIPSIVGIIPALLLIACAVLAFMLATRQSETVSIPRPITAISLSAAILALIASVFCAFLGVAGTRSLSLWESEIHFCYFVGGTAGMTGSITAIWGAFGRKRRTCGICAATTAVLCIGLFTPVLTALLAGAALASLWRERPAADIALTNT